MNLKRSITGVLTSAVLAASVLAGSMLSADAAAVPGFRDVDSYTAACLTKGYISLETGGSEGNGFYDLDDTDLYFFEQVSEDIMKENSVTVPTDFSLISVSDADGAALCQLLIADYFTCDAKYSESLLGAKKSKFRDAILGDLVKAGAASSKEGAMKLINSSSSADSQKMAAAIKGIGYEKQLVPYTSALNNISKVSGSSADYFEALSTALAIAELNSDRTEILLEMEKYTAGNTAFNKAADGFISAMEATYGSTDITKPLVDIANISVNNGWLAAKAGIPAIASAKDAETAMDTLFASQKAVRLALQSGVNDIMKQAVAGLKGKDSEDFHTAFTNYLLFQHYCAKSTAKCVADDDKDTAMKLKSEVSAFRTKASLINSWYENYLSYTGVKENEEGIPEGAVEYNGHYYMAFNNSISWIYAKEYCELMDGHLATVTDEAEQEIVEQVAVDCPEAENFWIGGYLSKTTNKWMWVDDTPFKYTNWDDKQPDFHENDEYYIRFTNKDIQYENWMAAKGKWNDCANEASGNNSKGDAVSIQTFAFICEWDDAESFKDYIRGDANNDGKVNVRDAAFIAKSLAQGSGDKLPKSADFNDDGKVNVRDAAAIAKFLASGGKQ